MTQFTLTMLDTSDIQGYVFRSNRLQENIGASEIVYRATTLWAFQALEAAGLSHNIRLGQTKAGEWDYDDQAPAIEDENSPLGAEVVYAGGGNTFLIFRDVDRPGDKAREFVYRLTRRILEDAPGLTLIADHLPFDWDNHSLRDAQAKLAKKLAKRKLARLPSTPLLGLGVTAPCASTGLVAVRTDEGQVEIENEKYDLRIGGQQDEEPRDISRETVQKLRWRDPANKRLEAQVGKSIAGVFTFPSNIDELGREHGQESFVAVVHADGNRMGEHVRAVGQGLDNRAYVGKMREFSKDVNAASLAAVQRVVDLVAGSLRLDEKNRWRLSETIAIIEDKLPFRPLVFGGDDVTFLANGQIGLSLAAAYLEAFEEEMAARKLPMTACAGIAIVKTHYPFARAYSLSEALTGQAKNFSRKTGDLSVLDWHFALTGLSGELDAIRQREYGMAEDGDPLPLRPPPTRKQREYGMAEDDETGLRLLLRPLRLRGETNTQDGRYWFDGVERVVTAFQTGAAWQRRRNKVKGLQEPLRAGPKANAVAHYLRTYSLPPLPVLFPGDAKATTTGWSGNQCVYFDALELMDHYIPLYLPQRPEDSDAH